MRVQDGGNTDSVRMRKFRCRSPSPALPCHEFPFRIHRCPPLHHKSPVILTRLQINSRQGASYPHWEAMSVRRPTEHKVSKENISIGTDARLRPLPCESTVRVRLGIVLGNCVSSNFRPNVRGCTTSVVPLPFSHRPESLLKQ